jgi:hypothetical protein
VFVDSEMERRLFEEGLIRRGLISRPRQQKAKESRPTVRPKRAVQQLKREIAAQCDILDGYTFDINLRAVSRAVDKLRQLSRD